MRDGVAFAIDDGFVDALKKVGFARWQMSGRLTGMM